MDRTALGVLGAISALVAFEGVQAAPIGPAQSFAELLAPIPNAVSRLKATNAVAKPPAAPDTTSQLPMTRAGTPRPLPPKPTVAPRPSTDTVAPKITGKVTPSAAP